VSVLPLPDCFGEACEDEPEADASDEEAADSPGPELPEPPFAASFSFAAAFL